MLCRELGAALTTSEMVIMQKHLLGTSKSKHRLDFSSERGPISIQIAGSNANEMDNSTKRAVDIGAQIVDINMGCPAKKVCNKAAGSALMQNEKVAEDIIKSVVNAVNVPVTLKMRTGWNPGNINAPSIAKLAENSGVEMITIHGRTRAQKYSGSAEYDTVRKIVNNSSIPIIANGDITSAQKAKEVLDYCGADGVMLGRATQGNPWLIFEVNHFLSTGKLAETPKLNEKIATILSHISQIYEFYGNKIGTQLSRKHIFWYSMHLDQKKCVKFWPSINRVTDHSEQYFKFHDFLYSL
jgi:tRNA-dihydrouridine synthase B